MMLLESPNVDLQRVDLQRIPETNQMDKALKQRLVGASVLIILAVIVLPMLLSGRSETLKQESREIELPAKPDELSIETRRFPVGVPGKPLPATESGTQDQSRASVNELSPSSEAGTGSIPEASDDSKQTPVTDSETDKTAVAEVAEFSEESPARTEAKPPAVTSITLSSGRDKDVNIAPSAESSQDIPRYLVQVASFSSEKNANALADTLRSKNLPVLMDVVDRTAGRLHRVRVGPYAERSEADAVVVSLSSDLKDLSPRVLDLRPGDSAPVSTPSDPLVRWVVQVGSFSDAKRAESLVAELRLSGLAAFSDKVTSANGVVYKVRVGPEINRDKAIQLAGKIKTEHKLDGFVTTQE